MPGRLALVVPKFPRASETFIVNKFLGLLERGWDVHVVCDRSDGPEWRRFPQLRAVPNIRPRVHRTWPHQPRWEAAMMAPAAFLGSFVAAPGATATYVSRGGRRFGLDVLRRLYLDAVLVGLKADIVHFEFGALAAKRMHLAQLLDAPIVVSFRGYDLNYVGLDEPGYYAEVWRGASALHFLGEDLWQRARRRGCPSEKPHFLIPPAIDTEFFAPGASRVADAGRPLRILSVGRLEWKKGYEDALIAVQLLGDRGIPCEYRIVGDGSFLGAVAFGRHQLGLEDVVTFLGEADRETVRAEMLQADVFLHAAVSEGFCNAVLEAQATELPVVCTDADGLRENVEDGVTGFVVPRRNPPALAAALARLAPDPARRRLMGEAGRRRVVSRFRLEDQISAFDALYRTVLEKGPNAETDPDVSEARPLQAGSGRRS
ncbi:MAG TPA: glycosyltransferase family 4 protein [Thermoanaerobaculia bacterium]|nr:glycosyltransferase family 4 protein [Thermoanaerobaculia bacterium]